jgi:hypothetical protein
MMMIQTAKEFYDAHYSDDPVVMMKDFARLHVREARKQFKIVFSEIDDPYPFERNDKLADVYPLNNII